MLALLPTSAIVSAALPSPAAPFTRASSRLPRGSASAGGILCDALVHRDISTAGSRHVTACLLKLCCYNLDLRST